LGAMPLRPAVVDCNYWCAVRNKVVRICLCVVLDPDRQRVLFCFVALRWFKTICSKKSM